MNSVLWSLSSAVILRLASLGGDLRAVNGMTSLLSGPGRRPPPLQSHRVKGRAAGGELNLAADLKPEGDPLLGGERDRLLSLDRSRRGEREERRRSRSPPRAGDLNGRGIEISS